MSVRTIDAIEATHARVIHRPDLPAALEVVTDSRTIAPGQTFLALRGPNYDGHAFVRSAIASGAQAVVVADEASIPDDVPALVVADTKDAYLAMAAAARRSLRARVVAITGSTGKTTTKTLIAQLLERAQSERVAATLANENNEIGVSKLFLALEPDVGLVVVEFGARHADDIARLVAIAQPDVAVLTNIGDAHLEIMGSKEQLIATKWSIFGAGAQPILNRNDADSVRRAPTLTREPRWFGTSEGLPRGQSRGHETIIVGDRLWIREPGAERSVSLASRLPGMHNRVNLAAALAAALALGIPLDPLLAATGGLTLPPGRYERSRIGELTIVFDAYNASMSGTLATLAAFASEPGVRRIAILSSMAELGEQAPAMHERVGAAAVAAALDVLLVGGAHAADLERGARTAGFGPGRIVRFERNADAAAWLQTHTRAGDVVLFKGSRRYRLEEIVDALRAARA